jgi:hypothetical protein
VLERPCTLGSRRLAGCDHPQTLSRSPMSPDMPPGPCSAFLRPRLPARLQISANHLRRDDFGCPPPSQFEISQAACTRNIKTPMRELSEECFCGMLHKRHAILIRSLETQRSDGAIRPGKRPPAICCLRPGAAWGISPRWSCGRVAEGGGLLNRYRVVKPYRGFESLRLRQIPIASHSQRPKKSIES